jgi:beta-glucosidase
MLLAYVYVCMLGRNYEYMSGEDPFLGSVMVPAAITGIQSQGVIANAKHFINNNQETDRHGVNAVVDERTMMEIYAPPFESAVVEGGVGSIMCSYNRITASTYEDPSNR